MTGPDPRLDPEGVALVEGILDRIGYRRTPILRAFHTVDFDALTRALARIGIALLPLQGVAVQGALNIQGFVQALDEAAGPPPEKLPTEPRARALWMKQHAGKGPPSSASWRGRERTTKFRPQ